MGYILPIKSISSEQYAMRLNLDPYNFANINEVQRIRLKLKSDFLEEFEESLQSKERNKKGNDKEQSSEVPSSSLRKMYIQPNPANLSPAISQVVGKGLNINAYI